MHIFSLLTIFITGVSINFHAQASSAEECLTTLRAGILAQSLEDVCTFDGGLFEGIKKSYTDAGCRRIIPQADIDRSTGEVLQAVRADYIKNGEKLFCSSNKNWYFSALNSPKSPQEESSANNNVEHALYMAIFDDNLQITNTYKSKSECEANGKKAVSTFRERFEKQGAVSAAKRVKHKCEPLFK